MDATARGLSVRAAIHSRLAWGVFYLTVAVDTVALNLLKAFGRTTAALQVQQSVAAGLGLKVQRAEHFHGSEMAPRAQLTLDDLEGSTDLLQF